MKSKSVLGREFSYIKDFSLLNIKCFGERQNIKVSRRSKPCMWNMILGENGVGKSTVLKAIAMTFLTKLEDFSYSDYNELNRNPSLLGRIKVNLMNGGHSLLEFKRPKSYSRHVQEGLIFDEFPLFAYGSYRNSGSTGLSSTKRSQGNTLFDEKSYLINAEDWFLQSDYRDAKSNNDSNQLSVVKELLLNILDEEVSDIEIREEKRNFVVKFKTRFGWVRFHDLSSGYRSLISWMVDLINWLTIYYPDSDNHCNEPAIVLVDEIDLHLHVSLQRKLVEFLTTKFPNIQFIVTAHSPLVIQGSQDENIILLQKDGDQVVVNHNPINVKNWRVDQILTSDLFGLETARGLETEKKLKRRSELLTKDSLNIIEQKEMKHLDDFMITMPNYEDHELDEASQIIKAAAATLRELKKSS